MRTHTIAAAVLAAALLTLTACSSDKHSNPPATSPPTTTKTPTKPPTSRPPTTPPTTAITRTPPPTTADNTSADLTAAVRTYSDAYFKPDPHKGYSLLSKRCQAGVTPSAYADELRQAVATYGHQQIKTVRVDRQSGTLGIVSYTYPVPVLNQSSQAGTRVNGAWRYDDC